MFALLLILVVPTHGKEPEKLTELRGIFEEEKRKVVAPLEEKYVQALKRHEIIATKKGDLDAALAFRKELESFQSPPQEQHVEGSEKVADRATAKPIVLKPDSRDRRLFWENLPELEVYGMDLVGQRQGGNSKILVSTIIDGKIRDLATVDASVFPSRKAGKHLLLFKKKFKFSGDLQIFLKNSGDATVTLFERSLKATAEVD